MLLIPPSNSLSCYSCFSRDRCFLDDTWFFPIFVFSFVFFSVLGVTWYWYWCYMVLVFILHLVPIRIPGSFIFFGFLGVTWCWYWYWCWHWCYMVLVFCFVTIPQIRIPGSAEAGSEPSCKRPHAIHLGLLRLFHRFKTFKTFD